MLVEKLSTDSVNMDSASLVLGQMARTMGCGSTRKKWSCIETQSYHLGSYVMPKRHSTSFSRCFVILGINHLTPASKTL